MPKFFYLHGEPMAEDEETKVKAIDDHSSFTFSHSAANDCYEELHEVLEKYSGDMANHEFIGLLETIKQSFVLEVFGLVE